MAVHVLIVEDERQVAEVLQLLLQMNDMTSEVVHSLTEAMTRLKRPDSRVDCIILDLSLPDAKGVQAQQAIQKEYPAIPVIANTGDHGLVIPAIRAGAVNAVWKPSEPGRWGERVLKAIALHEVRRQYQPYVDALEEALTTVKTFGDLSESGVFQKPEGV